jgi:hypothetical protein
MQQGLKKAEDQAYFDALFEMYGTKGWQFVQEDLVRLEEIYKSVDNAENGDELWFRKGQLDVIRQVKAHSALTEQMYQEALEKDGAEPEEPTDGVAKVIHDSGI